MPYYYYRTHELHNCREDSWKECLDQVETLAPVLLINRHAERFAANFRAACDQQLYAYNHCVFESSSLSSREKSDLIQELQKDFDKNHPETVIENKRILCRILDTLREHQIKPIIVVCPVTEFYREHVGGKKIIADFDATLLALKAKYGFQYFDFFETSLFQETDYRDPTHLNSKGAKKFSRLLDSEITW